MQVISRLLLAVAVATSLCSAPAAAQAPVPPAAPTPAPGASPAEGAAKPAAAIPAEKPTPKNLKKEKAKGKNAKREKKSKEEKSSSGFDPKSFLLKLVFNADEDGDGALSTEEFRNVPLLKELKKERVDSLFAEIDADSDAKLNAEEVGKGFGKITSLAKENSSLLDDEDAAKQAKKLKQLKK